MKQKIITFVSYKNQDRMISVRLTALALASAYAVSAYADISLSYVGTPASDPAIHVDTPASAGLNGGMARVTKELADQQATSAYDLWLAEETMRYMFRLLAMKMIMESPQQYGFILSASQLYQPIEYTIVKVNGPVDDWSKWAKNQGIDYLTLREHNPWIRAKSLTNKTGKSYTVRIPTPDSLSRSKQKTKVYNPAWISD